MCWEGSKLNKTNKNKQTNKHTKKERMISDVKGMFKMQVVQYTRAAKAIFLSELCTVC